MVSSVLLPEGSTTRMAAFRSAFQRSILAHMIHPACSPDDWHVRLHHDLASDSRSVASDEGTALEIAFGQARTAVTYAIELARAHRIPVQGASSGDDVWFQLGDWRTRIMLNRRERRLIARQPGREEAHVRWDCDRGTAMSENGPVDVGTLAREGIDAVVAAWRAQAGSHHAEAPASRNTEDELTRS